MSQIHTKIKPHHLHKNVEWEIEPDCKCGQLAQAIEDEIIFVSMHSD